jgi:hypothetical protein
MCPLFILAVPPLLLAVPMAMARGPPIADCRVDADRLIPALIPILKSHTGKSRQVFDRHTSLKTSIDFIIRRKHSCEK